MDTNKDYHVLLISGKMGSGKTTTANALTEYILSKRKNILPVTIRFASVIYEMHDAIRAIQDKYSIPKTESKDGLLLQLLGTEWGRQSIGANVWVDALKANMKKTSEHFREMFPNEFKILFIVEDTRFKNEFDAFPDAFKVRLEAGREIRKSRCESFRDREDHPSEIELDSYLAEDKFDTVCYTDILEATEVVRFLFGQLQELGWIDV